MIISTPLRPLERLSSAVIRGMRHRLKNDKIRVHDHAVIFSSVNSFSTNSKSIENVYVPRRTLMYVPGHDPKKLKKISKLMVDCAVLECEDGVAMNMKETARHNIREALDYLEKEMSHELDLALRVNSPCSGLMEADLKAIIGDALGPAAPVARLPQTILVPKVDKVEDLVHFTESLDSVKLGRRYQPRLITYVESAIGLINFNKVLSKAAALSENGHYHLDGAVFGSDDFIADIGAERTKEGKEVMYARQKFVSVAKAFRIQAIDLVYVDIKDVDGLIAQAREGASFGFTGKQLIHPSQVAPVEAAFTPSQARVEWATQLVQSFQEHQSRGQGALVFRGQMVDMPLLLQAQNVLKIVSNVHQR